jgi:hypothetical protein
LNFLKIIFSLIGLVWLIIFITNYFHALKPSSKPPVSISESKQITSEEKENIWKIGETIRRGDFEYTLNWVKIFPVWVYHCGKSLFLGRQYSCYKYEPKEGFKFVVVNITTKNIGKEKNSPTDWSIIIKTSDGVIYKDLEEKFGKHGALGEDATPEEADKYYCPEFDSSSIYPQETITGCKAIGIHKNKEPVEILFNFGWISVSEKRTDYIIKLK